MASIENQGLGILYVFKILGRPDVVTEILAGRLIDLGWDEERLAAGFEHALKAQWIEHVGRFSVLTDRGSEQLQHATVPSQGIWSGPPTAASDGPVPTTRARIAEAATAQAGQHQEPDLGQ